MMKLAVIAALAIFGVSAQAAENELTPEQKAAGWRLLFDGKTFSGWENPLAKTPPGDSFVIEDGCLKAIAKPAVVEDLFTRSSYRDFELEFDWKISAGGNSGVKYRIQDRIPVTETQFPKFEDQVNASLRKRNGRSPGRQEYVIGFEYQILDDDRNPDGRNGTTHRTGALYDVLSPSRESARPVGEWNHTRILVKGDRIEHWLNGEKVVEGSLTGPEVEKAAARRWGAGSPVYDLLVKQPRQACQISLQNHNSDAWFRNIRIRPL